jgi:hypothetical protein
MDTVASESTQQMLIPGECVDLYYPNEMTSKKQCFRTTVNSRYVQAFAQLGQGTSTFTIPPQNGVQDVIIQLQLPSSLSGSGATGLALARGWGYQLINQISFRVGGSSQYFLSGSQLAIQALRQSPNGNARDALFALGGNALSSQTEFNVASNLYAYCWLSLPWTKPSSSGKPDPLPTDLLTQQVQVTVQLNSLASIFTVYSATPSAIPSSLASAQFQVQQIMLDNQGDALARRVDMTTHSLSYPVEFMQQSSQVTGITTSANQTVNLTGFRSGEVKSILVWLTAPQDIAVGATNRWFAPQQMTMTYAGEVFARFDAGSSQLWNLINSRQTSAVSGSSMSTTGTALSLTAENYTWAELPFGQAYVDDTAHHVYVSGKEITNGIVQLQFTPPVATSLAGGASITSWILNVAYVYNSILVFSQGTCDYAF